jgi:PPM family protein phosphatase
MAPQVTFKIEGSLRRNILANADIFTPVLGVTENLRVEGANPSIKTKDPESHLIVEVKPQSAEALFVYAVDIDDKPGNGRLYMEDRFVYDPKDKKLLDVKRDFRLGAGANSEDWKNLLNSLKEREKASPLRRDALVVSRFFSRVVLDLPPPQQVSGEEVIPSPKTDTPKEAYLEAPILTLGRGSGLVSFEGARFRRMTMALPLLTSDFSEIPGGPTLLGDGLIHLLGGFSDKNPPLEKLHRLTVRNPQLHILTGGLLSLSRGDLKNARFRLSALDASHPAALYLVQWIDDFDRAVKNLYLSRIVQSLAVEEFDKTLHSQGAWISQLASLIFRPEWREKDRTEVQELFQKIEGKIFSGEADTLKQAFGQLKAQGSPQEAELVGKLSSEGFGQGSLLDLSQAGALREPFSNPLLLTVGQEKLIPRLDLSSAGLLFDYLGEQGGSLSLAPAARRGRAFTLSRPVFADQLDFSLRKFGEDLADPVLIGSLFAGQWAFSMGQRYALTRWGGLGLRSTLLATGLGVAAEAPIFELAHRTLYGAFEGEGDWNGLTKGALRNVFTFGALRGSGLAMKLNSDRIAALSPFSPFGKYTVPVFHHGGSLTALHLMNEAERVWGGRPRGGTWESRFFQDGIFYLQAGLAYHLGESALGMGLPREILDLSRTNDLTARMSNTPPISSSAGPKLLPPMSGVKETLDGAANPSPSPPSPSSPSDATPLLPKMFLIPGEPIFATAPNEPNRPRRAQASLLIPGYGEVSAYTHEGIDKKVLRGERTFPVNEDAFGMMLDPEGRPVLMVADGMGGHGSGDMASKIGVETTLRALLEGKTNSLGDAFLMGDQAIRTQYKESVQQWHGEGRKGEIPKPGGTVATAVRIHPEGLVDVASTGDTRVWILRAQTDEGFQVLEPFLPHSIPSGYRLRGEVRNTLHMNAHQKGNVVLSGLGQADVPTKVESFDYGLPDLWDHSEPNIPNQILETQLSLLASEDPHAPRGPVRLQPGDVLLLMSDGIGGFFDRTQMSETVKGQKDAEGILKAIQAESDYRFTLSAGIRNSNLGDNVRVRIKDGSFQGLFIGKTGMIFASDNPQDTDVKGRVGPDNVVALVYRYEPSLKISTSEKSPSSAPSSPLSFHAPISVGLEPGQHRTLGDLLKLSPTPELLLGIRVRRGPPPEDSQFWLLTPGGSTFGIRREYGNQPGADREVKGGEHLILGELGEHVTLRMGEGSGDVYPLFLDNSAGDGSRLPRIKVAYRGRESSLRFRSTTPELSLGRDFNKDLFTGEEPWIDSRLVDLNVVPIQDQWAYRLTAMASEGVYLGDQYFPQGQGIYLAPGSYLMKAIVKRIGAENSGFELIQDEFPLHLELPPVEVSFPDWRPKTARPASGPQEGAEVYYSPVLIPSSSVRSWYHGIFETVEGWIQKVRRRLK